jgi:hypothetical protein
MNRPAVFVFLMGALAAELAPAQINLGVGTTVLFATADAAREILTSRDDFVRRMSPFDRAARMKTDKVVSERQYLEFVGRNVLEWDDAEKQKIISALQDIQTRLDALALPFPKKVFVVKTTGDEEGGAPYTRANAIILPKAEITAPIAKIRKTVCHELFHILSRANPELREKLYAIIGFVKCGELEFPTDLKSRKITNPDALANDHCVLLKIEGKDNWAIPVLFSDAEMYDTTRGGQFFDSLQFKFLLVDRQGKAPEIKPAYDDKKYRLAGMEQISGFLEQVGRNTEYLIHPEEILADNFVLLISETRDPPSPEIIKKMEDVLKRNRTTEPSASTDARKPSR